MPMESWAATELRLLDLGDTRLNRRCIALVEDLARRPSVSVPQACENWAATKAAYRFWDSDRVTASAIRQAHIDGTLSRVRPLGRVLVIQDTTELNLTSHPATVGLGYLDHPACSGLKVHSSFAVSLEGVPLGLVDQHVWRRDPKEKGKSHRGSGRPIEEKESRRWLDALRATEQAIPIPTEVITVADREADMYELFALPRRPGSDLLVRADHRRRVHHEAKFLYEAIRQSAIRGEMELEVRRRPDRAARRAKLSVRYERLEWMPPSGKRKGLPRLALRVILVEEETAPSGEKPICWLLVTTLPVATLTEALECVRWYSLRWLIERYHYALKSGCQVEELQLETAERLEKALATYGVVAWRLLWLTYEARRHPQKSCDEVLAPHEVEALYWAVHKTPIPLSTSPTLQQSVRWIAQLGGFMARRGDGDPGVKVLWRGMGRLQDIAATWEHLSRRSPAHQDLRLVGNG